MPYGAHETMEVHEILNESINMINHFSLYAQECQDPALRQMIERHLQTALQSYHQLVAYTHDFNAVTHQMQSYMMANVQPQQIQYGLRSPSPQMPEMRGRLNDRQIASAMRSLHKNSAKNNMTAALECADPNIREMLIRSAINCANQAYELFILMNQRGLYQVPTMQDHTAKTYLHSYQPVEHIQTQRIHQ